MGSTATQSFRQSRSDDNTCSLQLYAPLSGLNPDQLTVSSGFGERIHPIDKTEKPHTGIDIANAVPDVVAAADGNIVKIGYNEVVTNGKKHGYGQYLVVQHSDNSTTLYAHLEAASIDLANQQNVAYPKTPGAPVILKNPIQVIGGVTKLGTMGATGGVTGPHLHFEYSNPTSGRTDPTPCITLPSPNGGGSLAGNWKGTITGTFTAGNCTYSGSHDVSLALTVSNNGLSGTGTLTGECIDLSNCTVHDYFTTNGGVVGSFSGQTINITYLSTITTGGCAGESQNYAFSGTFTATTISGTLTSGNTISLTKQ